MKTLQLLLLFLYPLFPVLGISLIQAQNTYLYKRVMIVENGVKSNRNDDAHYLTFTKTVCYESDKDGFSKETGILQHIKDENNIHCYYGDCSFGKAHYYFSNDYSRLNVQIDDKLIYVYQKEPSDTTTAKIREDRPITNEGGGFPIIPMPTIVGGGGAGGESSISSPSRSSYLRCNTCGGSGNCRSCKGKGHSSMWGEKNQICMGCNGTGRCSVCHGTGRIVTY